MGLPAIMSGKRERDHALLNELLASRAEQLEAEEAFAGLRGDARYQQVLEKMRTKRAESSPRP